MQNGYLKLTTQTFILHSATDPVGAELWGVLKNVIALTCGLDGLVKTGSLGEIIHGSDFHGWFQRRLSIAPQLGAKAEVAFTLLDSATCT